MSKLHLYPAQSNHPIMAPTNNHVQHFKLCNSTNTLGNTIAVLLLDYFGMSGLQNNRLEALTLAFLETSRMLFRLRNAMSDNKATPTRKRPSIDGSDRFLEHLRLTYVTFTGLHQYLSNKLKIERKHGFGKLGHSLRTICHGTDAERLRTALEQCCGGLELAAATFSPASLTDVKDTTGEFGYTALLAVFASRMKPLPAPPSPPPVIPTHLTRRDTPLDHLCVRDGSRVTSDSDAFRAAIANSASDTFDLCHSKPRNPPPNEGDYAGSVLLRSNHSRRYKDDRSLMPRRSASRNVEAMSVKSAQPATNNILPVEMPAHGELSGQETMTKHQSQHRIRR